MTVRFLMFVKTYIFLVMLDDIIEYETSSLEGRVASLEQQFVAQKNEITCLRATLQDALQRLSDLEIHDRPNQNKNQKRLEKPVYSLSNNDNTPIKTQNSLWESRNFRGRSTGQCAHETIPTKLGSSAVQKQLVNFTVASQLPLRRSVNYQSTSSLHSDSLSSNSVSPVPSSSPRGTPLPSARLGTMKPIDQHHNSLRRAKRWSSTGDFTHSPSAQGSSSPQLSSAKLLTSTKSLLSLFKPSISNSKRYSSREVEFDEENCKIHVHFENHSVALYAPSSYYKTYDLHKVSVAPHAKLKLDWVYGYRGRDCRNNLHLLPTGEVIYFVASVAILYNTDEHSQRHYLGHDDDIKCIAIHPNKLLVATGQASSLDRRETTAHIRIWNSVTLITLRIIGDGEFGKAITCLSFSKSDCGNLLAVIDEASDYNISIWEWQKSDRGQKLVETKCAVDTVVCTEWHPLERNHIVTCGKGHVSFWTLDSSGLLYKRIGLFESREKPKYVTCIAFNQNGDVLTGDSNGNIILWTRGTNTITKVIRAVHEGSIFTMCVLKDGSVLTGGGKDGRVVRLDTSISVIHSETQIEEHFGGIRTVIEGKNCLFLVGTTRNCILLGNAEVGFNPAMLGHAEEVWGLASHPTLPQFSTAAHDRLLQMWDSLSHTVVWSKDIGEQAQSVCFSPNGTIMVVGCVSGKWIVIDSETRELYCQHTDGSEPIQVVKFSPDGSLLAVGSKDNNIYIYQVNDDATKYSRVGRCMGHSTSITHLDWSLDSQYLRSNSKNYELLYWNAGVCRQMAQDSFLRDTSWASHSCTISFETIGIHSDGLDRFEINTCSRNKDGKLLAVGDSIGKVKLFSYPACQPKSLFHNYNGHSNNVTNICFLQDDIRLISSGGTDTSILQWTVN